MIGDRVVNDVEPKDRDLAMVFQSYALYPHLTVRKNIEFPLRTRGIPKSQRTAQVETAAESLGLDGLLDRKPGQLSGGQRQRVALARAIVRDPEAFLILAERALAEGRYSEAELMYQRAVKNVESYTDNPRRKQQEPPVARTKLDAWARGGEVLGRSLLHSTIIPNGGVRVGESSSSLLRIRPCRPQTSAHTLDGGVD